MIGQLRLWVFDGRMNVPDGAGGFTSTTILDEDDVHLVMRDAFMGMRGYGGIKSMTGRIMDGQTMFDTKVEDECLMQSVKTRPLLIPGNVNATIVLKGVGACS